MKKMLLVLALALLAAPAFTQELPSPDETWAPPSPWLGEPENSPSSPPETSAPEELVQIHSIVITEIELSPLAEDLFFLGNSTRAEREALVATLQVRLSVQTRADDGITIVLIRVKTETDCYGFCYEDLDPPEQPGCRSSPGMHQMTAAVPARDGGFLHSRTKNLTFRFQCILRNARLPIQNRYFECADFGTGLKNIQQQKPRFESGVFVGSSKAF